MTCTLNKDLNLNVGLFCLSVRLCVCGASDDDLDWVDWPINLSVK